MSEIKRRNEFGLLADDISTMVRAIDRLLDTLNLYPEATAAELAKNVKLDVDLFVGEAEQFDDLTILCLRYHRSALREES